MLNSKTVNINTIIERVKKDFPRTEEINREDVIEWVWEALSKIAAPAQYVEMYSLIKVQNYKGRLPSWLHEVKLVRYLTDDISLYDNEQALEDARKSGIQLHLSLDPFLLSEGTTEGRYGLPVSNKVYILDQNYIKIPYQEAILEVVYNALPLDTNNEPLVPQEIYYIEAVKWYCVMKLAWRLYVMDQTYQSIFQYAEREWLHYVNSASEKAKIPNEDGLVALRNQYLRIVPNLHRNRNRRGASGSATFNELNEFWEATKNG